KRDDMHPNVGISTQTFEPIWTRFFLRDPARTLPRRPSIQHRSGVHPSAPRPGSAPAGILDDRRHIVVEVDVQGIGPDDIDIVLSDQVLLVRAGSDEPRGPARRSRVEQTFDLPRGIELAEVKAELRGNLLRITLPRSA